MTFELAVRAALEELDGNNHLDYYRVRDTDQLTRLILSHLIAYSLARAEAEDDYDEAAGWAT